jgi:hypothetical protein
MSQVLEGTVAFENLTEHEMYNGQSTGKYSLVLSLDEGDAESLDSAGVKLREYEGTKQRKFASKFEVGVLNADGTPFARPSTYEVLRYVSCGRKAHHTQYTEPVHTLTR